MVTERFNNKKKVETPKIPKTKNEAGIVNGPEFWQRGQNLTAMLEGKEQEEGIKEIADKIGLELDEERLKENPIDHTIILKTANKEQLAELDKLISEFYKNK